MARKTSDTQTFKRHAKVVAAVELPGVPVGTPGKVLYVAGLRWFRYHVRFDNDVFRSSVDGNDLVARDEWELQQEEARRVARQAVAAG
ncbi:MAG: hypothetical protein MUF83_02485 [Acidimicrobiales bacterium]|jgi:hypothetical protein|nr:hypothetical protein [Acidimicrobiales bacterium]